MLPVNPQNYQIYGSEIHSELSRNLPLIHRSGLVERPDFKNILFGERVHWVGFSRLWRGLKPPSLFHRVLDIIRISSGKKMMPPYTKWRIAMVQNVQRLIELAVSKKERNTVSRPILPPKPKHAVRIKYSGGFSACGSLPKPTRSQLRHMGGYWAVFIYLLPEAFCNFIRLLKPLNVLGKSSSTSGLKGGNLFHRLDSCPLGLLARRAFSLCAPS